MERNFQKIGGVNLVVLLAAGVVAALVSRYAQSATGQVGVVFLGMGFLVAVVSWFQIRLEDRERTESFEFAELRKSASTAALFTQEAEAFPARRAREQFDRYLVPAFTLLLLALQGTAAWLLWRWLGSAPAPLAGRAAIATALWALCALVLFLLGQYGSRLARIERHRLLQPGSSYLLLGALIGLLVAIGESAAWFGFPRIDYYLARALTVVLGLVAIENGISLVLEIYRPRTRDTVARVLYESRLIGLLGQPGGLISTATQALDYQFGFKVSETWLFRFLERALAWLILLQFLVLFLFTSVVIVDPAEEGLLERFGRPVPSRPVLQPGLHFKWPWPIDRVYRFRTREVHTFHVGFVPDPEKDKERTVLWTLPHTKEEYNLLVASRSAPAIGADPAADAQSVPVNLLSVNIPVQYRIQDVRAWAYGHAQPERLLQDIANRVVVSYLVNVDIDQLMTTGRLEAADWLRRQIQDLAQTNRLGIEILFVGLQGIHPPVGVAAAYQEVVGAMQEKQTNILAAQAYWAEKIPLAIAEATNLLSQADGASFEKIKRAAAEAKQFRDQLAAYQASPAVYTQRTYLETFVRAAASARKYVLLATNTQDIIWLNLEDKIRADLVDLPLAPDKK
ncbi:MAG TPA: protease modulator HflK [Candidatus Paceibacterota bacterium]|nr:protease modulator HflK [Verrucomicrobiota bacterium]HRZ46076.1 protease modulator HflK [Candidatus Paceibacterota bacterium]HRZ93687.1 protease modulator HflK [Candidatus Paceibacterota bacterium]